MKDDAPGRWLFARFARSFIPLLRKLWRNNGQLICATALRHGFLPLFGIVGQIVGSGSGIEARGESEAVAVEPYGCFSLALAACYRYQATSVPGCLTFARRSDSPANDRQAGRQAAYQFSCHKSTRHCGLRWFNNCSQGTWARILRSAPHSIIVAFEAFQDIFDRQQRPHRTGLSSALTPASLALALHHGVERRSSSTGSR